MQEIKIPEGCKASIDFEKRVVVIESEFTPKEGDIIYCNYPDGDINVQWVTLVKKVRYFEKNNTDIDTYALYMICTNESRRDAPYLEIDSRQSTDCSVRLATPPEAQLLFDALAKEGKKWNAETMQIEDIEKDILVPESIWIYRYNGYSQDDDGDGLLIGFNDNNQLLAFCNRYYSVVPYSENNYDKIQCKLIPCNREDLKAGDTVAIVNVHLEIEEVLSDIDLYNKVVGDREYASVEYGRNIQVYDEKISPKLSEHIFYKVEPTNN